VIGRRLEIGKSTDFDVVRHLGVFADPAAPGARDAS
jgi:hypothetical protein